MYIKDSTGVFRSKSGHVTHREEHYPESGFDDLLEMQNRHFWYMGRYKFIFSALRDIAPSYSFSCIDLGGGVGGWIKYLRENLQTNKDAEIALADSSNVALIKAINVIGPTIERYQVDLMDLKWRDRWDIVFLLDVIEHIPNDVRALQEVARALKPDGKIILTVPALDFFWSHNDEAAKHLRRYSKKDLQELADKAGLRLVNSSYFMFFLSPLYWLSRIRVGKNASIEEKKEAIQREHKIPFGALNFILGVIFKAETPISKIISFPWGTSVLGVFEKVAPQLE